MSRSKSFGHDRSVLLSIVAQALLCNFLVCRFLLLSLLVMLMMAVSGNSKFLRTGFCTGAHRRCRVTEGGLHLSDEVNALDRRVKCFHKDVLSLKHLLLLNLVIFKLKCNNLIFNEMLRMCVCCILASSRITRSES
jgi:hypothetical protein